MKQLSSPVALTGLGFALVVVASAIALPGGATSSDPAAKIAAYYANHASGDLAADYASTVASALLLAFLCAVAGRIRGAAGNYIIASATIGAALELAATAIEMALAANVHNHAPATTTAALYQVASRLFYLSSIGLGLAVTTASVLDRSPKWIAWLGGVAGVALVVAGLAAAQPHGTLGAMLAPAWLLLVAWTVTASVTQLLRSSSATVSRTARELTAAT